MNESEPAVCRKAFLDYMAGKITNEELLAICKQFESQPELDLLGERPVKMCDNG